jgi:galactose mutarotase-like enzyme
MEKTVFKGIEAVVLENDQLRCTFLPEYGGKLASFYDKKASYEWLYQANEEILRVPEYGADFSKYDSSGFDEVFPSIDRSFHPLNGKVVPDHGEVWALPWKVEADGEGLRMEVASPEFPYKLVKTVTLEGDTLKFNYEAINLVGEDFAFIWTPHSLLNFNEETYIKVPDGLNEIMTVEHQTVHLGEWGTRHPYPVTQSSSGEKLDLSRVQGPTDRTSEKFYYTSKLPKGWCAAVQPDQGTQLEYRFPEEQVPYLGLWKTQGGYRGDYNFALEPCTGIYDDVYTADKIRKVSKIPANGEANWWFEMKISTLDK